MNEQYYTNIIARCELEIANLERKLREETHRADDNRRKCDEIRLTVDQSSFKRTRELLEENDNLKQNIEYLRSVIVGIRDAANSNIGMRNYIKKEEL